jgi:hypothetical protein
MVLSPDEGTEPLCERAQVVLLTPGVSRLHGDRLGGSLATAPRCRAEG